MIRLFHGAYDRTLRPVLKRLGLRKANHYNDVLVPEQAITDRTHHITYKPAAIDAIKQHVHADDRVLEVASGRGAFSVEIARQGAFVLAYEASKPHVCLSRLTAEWNDVAHRVTIKHRVVGEKGAASEVYGPLRGAASVHPRELPERDVLVLDCEGAETMILRWIQARPDRVLVETHPTKGGRTERVTALLSDKGYGIESVTRMDTKDNGDFVTAVYDA